MDGNVSIFSIFIASLQILLTNKTYFYLYLGVKVIQRATKYTKTTLTNTNNLNKIIIHT